MVYEIKMKVTGLEEAIRRYSNVSRNLKKDISIIMLEEVQLAISIMRMICPVSKGAPSDPVLGKHMVDTIEIIEWHQEVLRIIAGVLAPHAPYVEFGTSKMHARPFFRPPIWEAFFRMRERINEAIAMRFSK